jgi:arylsulfatase A-like enzyme
MKQGISRRDFLKLANLLPVGLSASKLTETFGLKDIQAQKNVIIVVFDAFSARNMSLYGYARDTTPNINKLAERAIVYHNHISGSNFTSSGTASILTGTLPWTHRALGQNGKVLKKYADQSIFSIFPDYHRMAYSHNEWVNTLLNQFNRNIEEWIPREQLFLFSSDAIIQKIFPNDRDISAVGWVRNEKIKEEGYAYSLYLSRLLSFIEKSQNAEYRPRFPRGLPSAQADNGFLLEHAIDAITSRINSISGPIFGYFHFLPPHDPYRPPREFFETFHGDGYRPVEKPTDLFVWEKLTDIGQRRAFYDEFILYVDQEFARFYNTLEESGALEDTWLILTSDHGEIFERGLAGHMTSALYQPLVHVPLLVFEPGRSSRQDIYTHTSAVDLVPTVAHLTGKDIPDWTEGKVLPPFQQTNPPERNVYALRSTSTEKDSPLEKASVTLLKGNYKLHYYFGYPELNSPDLVKLYDLSSDPEELFDLSEAKPEIAHQLLAELKVELDSADKPYI